MKSISKYMHHRSNHRNIVMRTILKMNTLWESNIIFLEGKQRKMYISDSSPPLICGLQPAAGRALSTGATVDSRQRITICLQSVLCVIWAARSGPGVREWSVLPLSSTKQACSPSSAPIQRKYPLFFSFHLHLMMLNTILLEHNTIMSKAISYPHS